MKIKLSQLRQIIKEEVSRAVLTEAEDWEPVALTPEQDKLADEAAKHRFADQYAGIIRPYNKDRRLEIWRELVAQNPTAGYPSVEAVAALAQRKHNSNIEYQRKIPADSPGNPKYRLD